ncbi:cobalamin biosynthesis protein CobD [Pseudooceanicola batsensis HTCC2597]|uniref:Cobalamin biosynthesis protein CobD n=1 Tax=Pseudooceanicola batsensis (strain ATCC BAA-863 / DSM 15984 / KCTC 12145 / HTCC2597) TaxID=252305 RepID=A3TVH8_PSEBH|nr:adenosylcobinamide-phosphate synthase CbiB [Pseudooceanicola batsensis]EAQ04524.1 cobalamin biosynthesis protein CobD [Pseudooceanicola batsensis HTCC2597]
MILAAALLLDAAFGEPEWLWSRVTHPAVAIGNAIGWADRRLNRGGMRKAKGTLLCLALIAGGLATGALIAIPGPVVEILAAAVLLAQRSLADHVRAVADGLRLSPGSGRLAVARIVGRDTAGMDPADISRAAIESGAENLSDGIVAPAFWFMVGGLPAMLAYKAVNTADSMIGYRTPRHADFGWASARCDDLLNLLPARLTAGLMCLAARHWPDWTQLRADARRHRSPNAGWPEAAMARCLGVALAGPRSYHGERRAFPFVNPAGRRTIGPAEIEAAVALIWRSWALLLPVALVAGH